MCLCMNRKTEILIKKKRKQYSSQFCTGTKHFKQSSFSFRVNEWYKLDSSLREA